MRRSITAGATCALLLVTGCVDRELAVLDDSGSMDEEQTMLADQIRDLVAGLTSPPDEDGDGEPDWNPVESLQVGIATTDMGTNGLAVDGLLGCGTQGATADPWGRDGMLLAAPSCEGVSGPVQRWNEGEDTEAFARRIECVAGTAGTGGCGFEQPLLSAARALERADAGFPREEALLAVLVVTDEEDCSLGDRAGEFYGSLPSGQAINVHCTRNVGLLASIDELVGRLSAGRSQDGFLFAAIAGIPLDAVEEDFDTILAHPDMQYVEDPTTKIGLRYACEAHEDGEARSLASPARRLVQMAQRFDGALVRSICEDSFQPALAELTRRIGARLTKKCLGRALTPEADGSVPCEVHETLPEGLTCGELVARIPVGLTEEGRELCEIQQAPGGAGSGWFYDVTDPTCDVVRFTEDAVPPFGADVRFQCLVEVPREGGSPTGP